MTGTTTPRGARFALLGARSLLLGLSLAVAGCGDPDSLDLYDAVDEHDAFARSADTRYLDATVTKVDGDTAEATVDKGDDRYNFDRGGASVDIKVGDSVRLIVITTPKGKTIVKQVVRN